MKPVKKPSVPRQRLPKSERQKKHLQKLKSSIRAELSANKDEKGYRSELFKNQSFSINKFQGPNKEQLEEIKRNALSPKNDQAFNLTQKIIKRT